MTGCTRPLPRPRTPSPPRSTPSGRWAKSPTTLSPADAKVFDALKAWRLEQARAASVPAYVVFPDKTLEAVAAARPRDVAGLLALPGVGQVKATRYGETLLAVVAEHADA